MSAAVAADATPNLMVTATASVVAYVVGATLNSLPRYTVEAPPLPPVVSVGGKGMAVADDEGNFVVGGVRTLIT